ncbi:MAG: hypothetical protein WC360_09685 [Opitutales bacterium]|jgi:hypothetical protein
MDKSKFKNNLLIMAICLGVGLLAGILLFIKVLHVPALVCMIALLAITGATRRLFAKNAVSLAADGLGLGIAISYIVILGTVPELLAGVIIVIAGALVMVLWESR